MKTACLLDLKPTQLAFGLLESLAKADKLHGMSKAKQKKHFKKNPLKVVIGPKNQIYIVDHHHLLHAAWLAGVKHVHLKVEADLSQKTERQFWPVMKKKNWIHLYDQFGEGPRDPLYLPPDILGLSDDPYRSLVWLVKEKGHIGPCDQNYYEFKWAQLFRRHSLLKDRSKKAFKLAVKDASKLARGPHAKHLPGYIKKL